MARLGLVVSSQIGQVNLKTSGRFGVQSKKGRLFGGMRNACCGLVALCQNYIQRGAQFWILYFRPSQKQSNRVDRAVESVLVTHSKRRLKELITPIEAVSRWHGITLPCNQS